ncbi:MAG: hypothetical protein Q4B50_03140 [Bacillota bacterium]|nr:hypothetical protein [Bacillota bacterium]
MAKPTRIFKKYRIIPLVLTGCLLLSLLTLVSLLLWTLISFYGNFDPAEAGGWAAGLYLLLLFLSCSAMTWLIRGGTVFPSLALALLAAVASIFLSEAKPSFGPILLKLLFSLVAAVLGFTLTKLLCAGRKQGRRQAQKEKTQLSSFDPAEHSSLNERI